MKLHSKINYFFAGDYIGCTMEFKSCKAARLAYIEKVTRPDMYNTLVDSRIKKYPHLLSARKAK